MSLTPEELQHIIDSLDEKSLKQHGSFGIYQYGGGGDESFIKANKEGLQLFALQLLKVSGTAEGILNDKEKQNRVLLEYDEDWMDENVDIYIHYIQLIADKQKPIPKKEYKETFLDKLAPIGCGLMVLILALSLIVGLVTIIKWIV